MSHFPEGHSKCFQLEQLLEPWDHKIFYPGLWVSIYKDTYVSQFLTDVAGKSPWRSLSTSLGPTGSDLFDDIYSTLHNP